MWQFLTEPIPAPSASSTFKVIAIGFCVLFIAKLVWLGYLALRKKLPDPGHGDVSGWGTPD